MFSKNQMKKNLCVCDESVSKFVIITGGLDKGGQKAQTFIYK